MTYVQLQGVDLMLSIRTRLDRPGCADQVARPRERMRPQAGADIYRGQARERDPLRVADHEVGVAVPVRIDSLDIDDSPHRFATGGMSRRAVRGLDRFRVAFFAETAKTILEGGFLRSRRFHVGRSAAIDSAAG